MGSQHPHVKEMQVEGSNLRGAGTLQWGGVLTTWREEEPQKAREVGRPDLGSGRGRTLGGTTVRISTAAHSRMISSGTGAISGGRNFMTLG